MSLLGFSGLSILVISCHLWHNLVHLENALFDSDCYGAVYDVGSKLCSCISTFLPPEFSCRPSYNCRPPRRPQDERRNKSGIHNRRGQYRYFCNKYNRADPARAQNSNLGHSDKEPTSDDQQPTPTPTSPNLYLAWRYSSCFIFSSQIYYGSTAKYYSWMQKRR